MEYSALREYILKNRILIVIGGPTASGKTSLSIELAQKLGSEIVSADSRQIYKYMDIGTAKPTKEELSAAKHHFIDIIEPDEYYSAGVYGKQAEQLVNNLFDSQICPIVVGGSGLYIKALCEGLFDENANTDYREIRKFLENELTSYGIDHLYEKLKNIDIVSYNLYSDKNPRRIIRALEYFELFGRPISSAHVESAEFRTFKPFYFAIDWDRNILYDRINKRTKLMWQEGLLEESKNLITRYSTELNSLNTVGYKETFQYIEKVITEEKAIELIAQHTRNYAKRQITWFKKVSGINWIMNDSEAITRRILSSH
jgi:tRNA dimethylallyltransferase